MTNRRAVICGAFNQRRARLVAREGVAKGVQRICGAYPIRLIKPENRCDGFHVLAVFFVFFVERVGLGEKPHAAFRYFREPGDDVRGKGFFDCTETIAFGKGHAVFPQFRQAMARAKMHQIIGNHADR